MEARAHWLGGIASLVLLACGGEETPASNDGNPNGSGGDGAGAAGGNAATGGAGAGAQGGSDSGGSGGSLGAYPGGPYGVQEGDVMENLLWEGYVNEEAQALANTQPFVDYSMDAVRQSGKDLAFIHFGAVF